MIDILEFTYGFTKMLRDPPKMASLPNFGSRPIGSETLLKWVLFSGMWRRAPLYKFDEALVEEVPLPSWLIWKVWKFLPTGYPASYRRTEYSLTGCTVTLRVHRILPRYIECRWTYERGELWHYNWQGESLYSKRTPPSSTLSTTNLKWASTKQNHTWQWKSNSHLNYDTILYSSSLWRLIRQSVWIRNVNIQTYICGVIISVFIPRQCWPGNAFT